VRALLLQSLWGALLLGVFALPALSAPLNDVAEQPRAVAGVVVDGSGGAVSGAAISLNAGFTGERKTVSDAAGRFVFDNVPNGPATVTVTFDQFAPEMNVSRSTTATKTDTPLRDVPQAISIVTRDLIADQTMLSMADVVRNVPGIGMAQGEGNRDTPIFRGNSSTSDFFVDGVRDDAQYFRDLYNVERVEALKGPNAMIFGRGGVGGVINRVTRQADWTPSREITLQGGSWDHRRVTGDIGQAVSRTAAVRITGLYENSDSYRQGVGLERYGVNPTASFVLGRNTTVKAGYEYFHDDRTADRGIPSFGGRPVATDASTFFGNSDLSQSTATVHALSAAVEHRVTLRNRTRFADYDKFYQNVFPGAVDAAGANVSISAYNNVTQRQNLFNQTDLIFAQRTGAIEHTIAAGAELGRQETDNFRETGFFRSLGANVTSVSVPLTNPVTTLPIDFRQNATDADNHGVATVAALYVQDQMILSDHLQAIVGLRYDRFKVDFTNHRTAADFGSTDDLVSPRVGLVYKPIVPVSVYASYTLSYLPRAGEQLASLSVSNQALKPEQFRNYEVGVKWDFLPALSLTTAVYRLDRTNVIVPDPNDPTVSLLVDGQRSKGLELSLTGRITRAWSLVGAYAYQDGEIRQTLSSSAPAGASLAQLPKNAFSLWNRYEVTPTLGVGLGLIHRSDIFTSTDNTVVLPSFTRVDAAVYYAFNSRFRAQVNVENLFDEAYYASAHSNHNITPGSPRAVRVALISRF
jgi:catecholate siderophore receptor